MIKNKKGWIRIVEAFISVMLIAGVLLIVINQGYIGKRDISTTVYEAEVSILREIELNDDFRDDILKIGTLPVNWDESGFPLSVKEKVVARTPSNLECVAKICELDKICTLDQYIEKDIFVSAVAITANIDEYSPRQLKLFCW